MILYSCPGCDVTYHHACEIVQAGGSAELRGKQGMIWRCKCGVEVNETELWKTNPEYTKMKQEAQILISAIR